MNQIAVIDRRPGRLWKFLQFPVTRIVLLIAAIAAIVIVLLFLPPAARIHSHSIAGIGRAVFEIGCLCGAYVFLAGYLEQRRVTEFCLHRAWREFGSGFLLGFVLFSSTILTLYWLGLAEFDHSGSLGGLVYPLAAALATAFLEEIAVRGVLFRIIEESLGSWIALGLSAAAFGALHAANPGATLISCVAIALEAGVLLAAAYMYTRRLWLAIGLHTAWNFTEGGVFGASVSGGHSRGLLTTHLSGPELLSGGPFGPEASVVAVVICLTAAVVLLVLAARRGRIVKFPAGRRGVA